MYFSVQPLLGPTRVECFRATSPACLFTLIPHSFLPQKLFFQIDLSDLVPSSFFCGSYIEKFDNMASAIALESPDTVLLDASLKRKVDEVTEDTPTTTESVEATENDTNKRSKLAISLDWLPPSVTNIEDPFKFASSTYHSEIPQSILQNKTEPIVLGVDEAGRGPVLGPMVYGIAYSLESFLSKLQKEYGFADSKVLTDVKREELFKQIEDPDHELHKHIGWATTTMTARDISSGMLQSVNGKGAYNLNEQAHDTTINLIKQVLAKGVKISKIFVDTVGPPVTYQAKLKRFFPEIDVTVTKKADSIYPIVSTASVVAKVTRDTNIKFYNENLPLLQGQKLGSGYPSDPNTSKWLNSNVDPVFGWCYGFIRFSWQTAKDSLVKNNAAEVVYEDQGKGVEKGYQDVFAMIDKKKDNSKLKRNYFCSSSNVNLL